MSGTPIAGYSIFTGLAPLTKTGADGAPIQGPRAITLVLNFTAQINVIIQELFQEDAQKQLDFVQTIHVDNSASGLAISITTDVTQQRLVIPANKQAILPLYCIENPRLTFTKAAAGNETVKVILTNVAQGPIVW